MSECKQCPHVVGDITERDCAFPDCVGGWEEGYKQLVDKLATVTEQLNGLSEDYGDLLAESNKYEEQRDRAWAALWGAQQQARCVRNYSDPDDVFEATPVSALMAEAQENGK